MGLMSGGLGFGVAFTLDYDSANAKEIMRDFQKIDGASKQMADSMDLAMNRIQIGTGMVAVGAALAAPFVMGIDAASDLEENLNKTRVAFGDYAKDVEKFADTSLDTFGVDKIKALDMASLFGDMSTGMGMNQKDASKMSIALTGLAGDLSSFKNISADMSQNALKGIFTGETESLKNLGIVMTETNLTSFMATQGINKNFKDLTETEKIMLRFNFVMDRSKNSIGDFARTSEGYANSKRVFEGSLKEVSATMGGILMPMVARLFQGMTGLLKRFRDFAQSPIGRVMMQITLAFSAFLIVGGLALILMGGLRLAAFKMAGAFGNSTKAMILQTLATKGLSAGLRQMAVAAWAATGPFVLIALAVAAFIFIAKQAWDMVNTGSETMVRLGAIIFWLLGPIGWIIGIVAMIKRGFTELDNFKGDKGGLIGFFMRVAGVLEAVGEIWNSFNGETFQLSEELASKLEAMGILDFVVELGTWISRVKMFFDGFINAMSSGFEFLGGKLGGIWDRITAGFTKITDKLGGVFEKLGTLFAPVIKVIGVLLEKLGFGKGALTDWGTAGEIFGNLIIGALDMVITVLGALIDGVIFLIDMWVSAIDLIVSGLLWIQSGIQSVIDWTTGWVNLLWNIATVGLEIGVSFMSNLWEGLKTVWESIWTWLQEIFASVMQFISAPLSMLSDGVGAIADLLGGGDDEDTPAGAGGGAAVAKGGRNTHSSFTSKTVMAGAGGRAGGGTGQPAKAGNETFHLAIHMDGDKVADKVITKQELKNDRK